MTYFFFFFFFGKGLIIPKTVFTFNEENVNFVLLVDEMDASLLYLSCKPVQITSFQIDHIARESAEEFKHILSE